MALNEREAGQLRAALQEAVVKCSERCLYQSAKWAAELLTSLPTNDKEFEQEDSQMTEVPDHGIPVVITGNNDPEEALLEAREVNKYLLAKSFFDCREFDRCAAVFLPDALLTGLMSSTTPVTETLLSTPKGKSKARVSSTPAQNGSTLGVQLPKISQKSLFLALYAKLMSGEKKKDEETEMIMGPHDSGKVINKQLSVITRYLEIWISARLDDNDNVQGSQGWLEYLYGTVLAKEKNEEEAMRWLVRSVHICPMNWGCWLEMTALIGRQSELQRVMPHLPQNIFCFIFYLHTELELYQSSSALAARLSQLLAVFPTSSFLLTARALLAYHLKDFVASEAAFSELLSIHPHRLDSMDHYSNILYVMGCRPKLAFLAHLCTSIDKFRPETCVTIGNYYSLLSQHEKAVNYFRRALTLDRTCLSAWTLMGHEYIELKNTHAAIESYRRAVDVNRRDYRAWYGLGQTYEVLEMHAYALWYYKRAAGLRPWDAKMWAAVGNCLQRMGRYEDGIKSMKRALQVESQYDSGAESSFGNGGKSQHVTTYDPDLLLAIANMYNSLNLEDEARSYMELCIAQEEGLSSQREPSGRRLSGDSEADEDDRGNGIGVTAATSKARMWLARYAMKVEDYNTAMRLANELCQDGVEVEEAKALIRDVRSRLENADDTAADAGMTSPPEASGISLGMDAMSSPPEATREWSESP